MRSLGSLILEFMEMESRMVVARGGGRQSGGLSLNRYRAPVWEDNRCAADGPWWWSYNNMNVLYAADLDI